MKFLRASDTALLAQADSLEQAVELNRAWQNIAGIRELVPGASTVLVHFDPARVTAEALMTQLESTDVSTSCDGQARHITIPVTYDGEDLASVADLLGLSEESLIQRHLAAEWTVAFSGFAPGFGYAKSSDPIFQVPRRSSPRTRVPAGAVGLAGPFTGIYPRESPGGWQLIGHTRDLLWDIHREPPALMAPGTVVRFERETRDGVVVSGAPSATHDDAAGEPTPAAVSSSSPDGNALTVISPGLQMLIQDTGRAGHAALGVSTSGAADRTAMRQANQAVGNHAQVPVIECIGAVELEYHGAPSVAVVTGAMGQMQLTATNGAHHKVSGGLPFAVDSGDRLSLGYPQRGLRYVLAVRGGIQAESALGSLATDTLAGLGPSPLKAGDHIAVGDPEAAPYAVEPLGVQRDLPAPGDTVDLAITLGPREDWFTPAALEALVGQDWEVTTRSDRVGLRLLGEVALERRVTGELPSEGAVTGAIQVPPDGQPVLFLPDHPLTGGYPIVGAVTRQDLDLAAQLPPGVRIRFTVPDPAGRQHGSNGTEHLPLNGTEPGDPR